MAAIGKPSKKEDLPTELQERQSPNDRRKLAETVIAGPCTEVVTWSCIP